MLLLAVSDKPFIDFTKAGNQKQPFSQSIPHYALLSLAVIDFTKAGNQ